MNSSYNISQNNPVANNARHMLSPTPMGRRANKKFINGQNINQNDIAMYKARLKKAQQFLSANKSHENINFSKNSAEHEQLKKEAEACFYDYVLKIHKAKISDQDKIEIAKKAERYFKDIVDNDAMELNQRAQLVKDKMAAIRDLIQRKAGSNILTQDQKNKIEEYKKRKAKQRTKTKLLLLLAIIFAILTIVGMIVLYTNFKKQQSEKYADTEWKKNKDIIDNPKYDTKSAFDDDLVKKLLGDDKSTITETRNTDGVREFTVTNGTTTTYYRYDKTTDVLMSKTDIGEAYVKIDNGDNYLANYFASEGGIVISDKDGIEKVVKVGNDTYKYDYNTEDIVKNDKTTYKQYPNGKPFLVKAYDNENKHWINAGWAVTAGLCGAALYTRFSNVSDGGNDKTIKSLIADDENFQHRKNDMLLRYDNMLNNDNSYGTLVDGMGNGETYGRAYNNLRKKYDDLTGQPSAKNGGDVDNLDIVQIANNDLSGF